ncbi:MAG TPA: LPS export ABC transporter periplasmic protein LptC, partial [Allosphingosinicella sp.]|jgi:lipopolysaccharide export system protein LptC
MSELAEQDRRVKRSWARPGSSHDRLIRLMKFVLPLLVGLVLAFLALIPLEDRKEISFLLDKNKVDQAQERLKVEAAQYRGQDELGRAFVLDARSAIQANSADPVIEIADMSARLQLDDGPAAITAGRARFNPQIDRVAVLGPVQFRAADGYQLRTADVMVDLRDRSLQSQQRVEGQMPLGHFSADRLKADLPERTVVLEGGARLHINQGAFRRQ